jgi:hypothetical protein
MAIATEAPKVKLKDCYLLKLLGMSMVEKMA